MKKEDTPQRIARRNYEKRNKELRKKTNAQFSTFIPRSDYDEINEFLKKIILQKLN